MKTPYEVMSERLDRIAVEQDAADANEYSAEATA